MIPRIKYTQGGRKPDEGGFVKSRRLQARGNRQHVPCYQKVNAGAEARCFDLTPCKSQENQEQKPFRGQEGMQDLLEGEVKKRRQPIQTSYPEGFAVKGNRYMEH